METAEATPGAQAVIKREGAEDLRRYELLRQLAKEHFAGTALVEDKPWSHDDVKKTQPISLEISSSHP